MADPGNVLQKVLKLKHHLSHTQDTEKIMKALKGLQNLEISLDTLVETGVGKTVNSFRKHATVGNLAKSLISCWKKLVPQQVSASEAPERKNNSKNEKESSDKTIKTLISKENKYLEKSRAYESNCKATPSSEKQKKAHSLKVKHTDDESLDSFSRCGSEEQRSGTCMDSSGGLERESCKHICKESHERGKSSEKHTSSSSSINKGSNKEQSSAASRKDSVPPKVEASGKDSLTKQTDTEPKGTLKPNSRIKSQAKSPRGEVFEPPTMSFESYLNYDQVSHRRKRKACLANRQMSNANSSPASLKSKPLASREKEEKTSALEDNIETPSKKVKTSLQDLLNTPLPKVLPELSSPPYATEFKAPQPVEAPQQICETAQFTGRRLNSKMQVYSGSKTICLSKMLTLYEQCIRVLQNNIDLLHEVGGVPFEILEPVLIRCTPEQLFRVEDCNPAFVEDSGHLWKKHCQRDFRNEQLLEYESWREMYLRLFNQREEKLKSLTKSILSAQSEKPKGRQVKMAFIHGIAKPTRSVRRQQEMHGIAAGSIVQLHPVEKCETKSQDTREKSSTSPSPSANKGNSATSSTSSIYTNGTNQDTKKLPKKMAPMMRKSLRAFKNRVGPR